MSGRRGMSERCRSCDQRVVWALTEKGRRMPVDPAPVDDGNLVLTYGNPVTVHVDATFTGPRHVSHFATCPNADAHRRRNPRRKDTHR